AAGELAGHGQPGEACSADKDVIFTAQRRAFGATRRAPSRHAGSLPRLVASVPDTETVTPPRTVEGSGGMLLEIDGQIVPNYDATIVPFDEGDVVSGKRVRIAQS